MNNKNNKVFYLSISERAKFDLNSNCSPVQNYFLIRCSKKTVVGITILNVISQYLFVIMYISGIYSYYL
jgi:hypothetical protein